MKRNSLFKVSSIFVALLLVILLSTQTFAFAADTTDKWVVKDSMSTPRMNLQAQVVNGDIYVIGGQNTHGYLTSVEKYNPDTGTWTTMKSKMTTERYSFQTEVVNGKIYVIGGANSSGYLNSVEEYDPEKDIWTTMKPMRTARIDFQTQVINGKIYAIGGFSGSSVLASVEVFDPSLNTWSDAASMLSLRNMFHSEIISGKIYVVGGYYDRGSYYNNTLEEYDPLLKTWATRESISAARTSFTTEVANDKLYLIGGFKGNDQTTELNEYDPLLNKWITKNPMLSPGTLSTVSIGGIIYAFGYYSKPTVGQRYDTKLDKWDNIASTSVLRSPSVTIPLNGKIYAIGGYSADNKISSSVEEYTIPTDKPTLTVTSSSNKVKVGQQFTTAVAIHNVTNICAEDIKITYDTNLFTYAGAEAQTGLKIYKEDTSVPGTIRFICACEGKDNSATGDKGLINLKFTAKSQGSGKVDIIKGRIADNATLEEDVTDANCGEDTITVEGYADVNKTGDFTLLDLGIDGWYNGMNAADTDTAKFNADVVVDGKIDDNDLAEITKGILANRNYQPNT